MTLKQLQKFWKVKSWKFGVPKYILIDNGIKWFVEFDQLCKNYNIVHQYIMLQWPMCNGMVERLVKMLKHGFTCFLQLLSMHKTRMTNYPRSCLDTNVGCKQTQSFIHIYC
jgi:hypothetical protein